jgi:hypothetical protein
MAEFLLEVRWGKALGLFLDEKGREAVFDGLENEDAVGEGLRGLFGEKHSAGAFDGGVGGVSPKSIDGFGGAATTEGDDGTAKG